MQLLQRLSQSRGSLLDDLGLITVLREMKRTHLDIADKQAETSVAVALADTTRSAYGSVATAGAVVYIGTLSMAAVSPNYQMAFTRFLNLFVTAVRSCSCEDNQPVPSRWSVCDAPGIAISDCFHVIYVTGCLSWRLR